jgi:aerobic-type carbon monoxide dehydrogenase small subunit (CoxS/CutS family)
MRQMPTDTKHIAQSNGGEKNTILFTLIYKGEEYQVQTRERQYFSLMTLISDYLTIPGFGLCSGMGSCGTCLVDIDGTSTLACEIPVNDDLANTRIKIDVSN